MAYVQYCSRNSSVDILEEAPLNSYAFNRWAGHAALISRNNSQKQLQLRTPTTFETPPESSWSFINYITGITDNREDPYQEQPFELRTG